MDIKELKAALVSKGWSEDRFGNLKREVRVENETPRLYRVKVQKISVRLERQFTIEASPYSPESKDWALVSNAYLKDIKVREDGGIIIGRKVLK
jgi:hypothetical protein